MQIRREPFHPAGHDGIQYITTEVQCTLRAPSVDCFFSSEFFKGKVNFNKKRACIKVYKEHVDKRWRIIFIYISLIYVIFVLFSRSWFFPFILQANTVGWSDFALRCEFQKATRFCRSGTYIFRSLIPKTRRILPRARQSFRFQKTQGTKINLKKFTETFLKHQRTIVKKKIKIKNFWYFFFFQMCKTVFDLDKRKQNLSISSFFSF